ncbi:hypothetical protein GQR58_024881 [Nymphon striatum]|nr:hypothetical protein GQR58_024881 [Nymphon striatum]
MSVICHNFVQNTWKKDLCSNCFKSSAEHKHAETRNNELLNFINGGVTNPLSGSNGEILGRYISQATTIYQSRNLQARAWQSLIIDQKSATKGHNLSMKLPVTCLTDPIKPTDPPTSETKEKSSDDRPDDNVKEETVANEVSEETPNVTTSEKKEVKPSVRFHEEEVLVIGYGGNDYDPNEPAWEMNSEEGDDWMFETMDNTTEERILTRMTKENTEFNSDNSNLLKDPAKEEEVHCMNVKNAISMLEGRNTKTNGVDVEKEDTSSKVRNHSHPTVKPVPEVIKLENADVKPCSNKKSREKENKNEKIGTAQTNSTKVEENKPKVDKDQTVEEKKVTSSKKSDERSEKNQKVEEKKVTSSKKSDERSEKNQKVEEKKVTISKKSDERSEKIQKVEEKKVTSSKKSDERSEKNQKVEEKKVTSSKKTNEKSDKNQKTEENPSPKIQENLNDFPVYSIVSKQPKSVEPISASTNVVPQNCNEIQNSDEPYYKSPTANNKTVVPESQAAEFLNYDVPARSNPDADEHNIIDELNGSHYEIVNSDPQAVEQVVPEKESLNHTTDLPPELPTTPPPNNFINDEHATSKQIAEHIGITPTAQSSFLHNTRSQEFEKCNTYNKEEDNFPESDYSSKDSEEVTTTTNPIYTPTNVDSSDSESSTKQMPKIKPKIPVKPSNLVSKAEIKPTSDSDSSAKSDDGYDTVEYPQENFQEVEDISSEQECEIYQDVATVRLQAPSNDKNIPLESELSKQRSGSSKRQAPPPPKTTSTDSVPLPPKKSQRHSMTFPDVGSPTNNSKPKSCTLSGFHRIRIGSSKSSPENKEAKTKKGKFWKKILNRFSRDSDNSDSGKSNNFQDDQKVKLSKTPSDSSAKKVRLQIIHPIDFEQSGGPQIIESPSITTAEDGMPSVIDCASPASSICSGTSPGLSDDNATSSDSGGNYESVGEDEDSSTGHNGYASQGVSKVMTDIKKRPKTGSLFTLFSLFL